ACASGSAPTSRSAPDDNATSVGTLPATDKDGGVSQPASATIRVDNVAPTAGVSGPADGVRGQARNFTLTAGDPSSADQAAGFTFAITWGDGATQTLTGPSGTTVSHVYTTAGTYNVQVTATDKARGTRAGKGGRPAPPRPPGGHHPRRGPRDRPDRSHQDRPVRRRHDRGGHHYHHAGGRQRHARRHHRHDVPGPLPAHRPPPRVRPGGR